MNLQQHILEWLDSIGADGLMNNTHGGISAYEKDEIDTALNVYDAFQLVPAYRHADGTYHAEPENVEWPCDECGEIYTTCKGSGICEKVRPYHKYQSWLSHKEEMK